MLELEQNQSYIDDQPLFRLHSINTNMETSFIDRVLPSDLIRYSPITIFSVEKINPDLLSLVNIDTMPHKLIFIPNLEWLSHHYSAPSSPQFDLHHHTISNSKLLLDSLRSHEYRLLILSRNDMTYNFFTGVDIPTLPVPWPIYSPNMRKAIQRETTASENIRLILDLGNGGYGMRKAPDVAFNALLQTSRQYRITIKLDSILAEMFKDELAILGSKHILTIIDSWIDEDEINALYLNHDCLVYPSRFDGHGLALERAKANGLYLIHTDGEPWNSITSGFPRQLIKAEFKGNIDFCPYYEPSPLHLTSLLDNLSLSALKATRKSQASSLYESKRHHLISHLNAFLKGA